MSDSDGHNDLEIDIGVVDDNSDPGVTSASCPSTSSQNKAKFNKELNEQFLDYSDNLHLYNEVTEEPSDSSDESDSESENICAICLGKIKGKIGSPDALDCKHFFCLLCILEWAKNNPVCPQDRKPFGRVLVKNDINGEVISKIVTIKEEPADETLGFDDPTYCEVCGSSEREYCLLLCDGCDLGYHLECLTPPLSEVPIEEWFCPLCVTAGLPEEVDPSSTVPIPQTSKSDETKQHPKKKKKKKSPSQSKARMIPRTRASERVLQRISQTRKKKEKKKEKKEKKSTVQSFKKPKPFGSIADDDIDAVFNYDAYADKLLDCSSLQSKQDKKKFAFEKFHKVDSNPSPSYCGRALHPKVTETSRSSEAPDILTNILEDQFVLLSSSKNICLTEKRKLTKIDDENKIDFNNDRKNIMSESLPSQKKTKGNNKLSEVEDHCKNETNCYTSKKENFNEYKELKHDSNYYKCRSPDTKSYHKTYSTSDHSKSHSMYHQSFRRRSRERCDQREYYSSSRESAKRERSKSTDRPHRGNSMEKYESRYSSSRSRNRRSPDDSGRTHYSRTPERDSIYKKRHSSRSKSRSNKFFGGSSYTEPRDTNIFSGYDQLTHNLSVHTMNISSFHKKNFLFEGREDDISKVLEPKYEPVYGSENIPANSLNGKKSSICDSTSKLIKDLKIKPYTEAISKFEIKLNATQSECDVDDATVDVKGSNTSNKKSKKFSKLFENVNSESGTSLTQLEIASVQKGELSPKSKSFTSRDEGFISKSSPQEKKKVNTTEANSEICANFSDETECGIYSPHSPFPINLSSPERPFEKQSKESLVLSMEELTLPKVKQFVPASSTLNFRSFSSDQELEDIRTLSKTSRDLIINSLFGNHRTKDSQKILSKSILNNENKKSNEDNKLTEKSVLKKVGHKNTSLESESIYSDEPVFENKSQKVTSKDNTDISLKSKITLFDHLFGESSSDAELSSDSEFKGSSPSKISDKFVNQNTFNNTTDPLKEKTKRKLETSSLQFLPKEKVTEILSVVEEGQKEINNIEKQKLYEDSQMTVLKNVTPISKIKANKLLLETKVVEEAKRFLNPYYLEKGFSKQIYKEIISKCVRKVLEVECSDTVEPKKIKKLVDGYVHLYQHRSKKKVASQKYL